MRSARLAAVILIPTLILAACGDDDVTTTNADGGKTTSTASNTTGSTEQEEANGIVVFGDEDRGATVSLPVDTSFDVALDLCIGCGYSWTVVTPPDDAVLKLTGDGETEQPSATGDNGVPLAGGMTEHVFHYDVVGKGTATIELGYVPPGTSDPEDTFTFTVDGGGTDAYRSGADHVFTDADDQTGVTVVVGDSIDVVLESCPSCGYSWEPIKAEGATYDEKDIISLLSSVDVDRPHDPGITGAPADHVVHLTANMAGEENVLLGYFPPGKDRPEKTVVLTVTVTE